MSDTDTDLFVLLIYGGLKRTNKPLHIPTYAKAATLEYNYSTRDNTLYSGTIPDLLDVSQS